MATFGNPNDQQPTEPQGGEQQQNELPPIHPAWNDALATVPESLREPIYNQIRESEKQSQSAIEKARQSAVPEEWVGLINEATEQGLTPDALADGFTFCPLATKK